MLRQRHKHLPQTTAPFANVILDDGPPTHEAMLVAKALEYPLRHVAPADFVCLTTDSRRASDAAPTAAFDPGCFLTRGLNVKLSVMRLSGSLVSPQ